MNDEQRKSFLQAAKNAFNAQPRSVELENRDRQENKKVKQQIRKRWFRELQKRCGTRQLWELISFTGKWDPQWLQEKVDASPTQPSDPKDDEAKHLKARAVEPRYELRICGNQSKSLTRVGVIGKSQYR